MPPSGRRDSGTETLPGAFNDIEPWRFVLPKVGFRRRKMKKFLIMMALSGGLVLSACNTLHGAAEDVESTTDCVDGVDNNC